MEREILGWTWDVDEDEESPGFPTQQAAVNDWRLWTDEDETDFLFEGTLTLYPLHPYTLDADERAAFIDNLVDLTVAEASEILLSIFKWTTQPLRPKPADMKRIRAKVIALADLVLEVHPTDLATLGDPVTVDLADFPEEEGVNL